MESKELAIRLARALDAKKALNIRVLHVEDLTTVADYFVIATGTSTTHVGALADEEVLGHGGQVLHGQNVDVEGFLCVQRTRQTNGKFFAFHTCSPRWFITG